MIKIGKIELGKIPRIAIAINDREDNKLIKSAFVDIFEIRVDEFKKIDPIYVKSVVKARRKIGVPLILTVRSKEEGGQRDISNELKLNIFKECIPLVNAVDIELRSPILSEVVKIAKKNKKVVIVSWHNFTMTPNDKMLKGILDKAKRSGASLVKIAVKANKAEDLNRLMRFTIENKSKNIITISLGEIGSISRLTFPGFGSLITYAYINRPSGLGQRTLDELRDHLRAYYPKYNEYYIIRSRTIEYA
ncbi:MAG: type I 3-dehydroquinate dehydratase [Candidatus Omnitrophica bacterium CG11_big_fil_rev_8_21_14_0_20_43_6]|nr:MAG: type I 3-dehydroquinate dehydratase [Candidatus Omnitrophica bacterium CG11_big_fil_rev_8_21_14_0_20_43_6]